MGRNKKAKRKGAGKYSGSVAFNPFEYQSEEDDVMDTSGQIITEHADIPFLNSFVKKAQKKINGKAPVKPSPGGKPKQQLPFLEDESEENGSSDDISDNSAIRDYMENIGLDGDDSAAVAYEISNVWAGEEDHMKRQADYNYEDGSETDDSEEWTDQLDSDEWSDETLESDEIQLFSNILNQITDGDYEHDEIGPSGSFAARLQRARKQSGKKEKKNKDKKQKGIGGYANIHRVFLEFMRWAQDSDGEDVYYTPALYHQHIALFQKLVSPFKVSIGKGAHKQGFITIYRLPNTSIPSKEVCELMKDRALAAQEKMKPTKSDSDSDVGRKRKGKDSKRKDKQGKKMESRDSSKMKEGSVIGRNAKPIEESNVGHEMLRLMGWSQGEALGSTSQSAGLIDPIAVKILGKKKGLGYN
ncbi:hypothetical protein MP638_000861 [Amoeboaphelidium occidentale]|nr:hypothetical protein MP638_000861 [Amoeboaphelidium occidentale]